LYELVNCSYQPLSVMRYDPGLIMLSNRTTLGAGNWGENLDVGQGWRNHGG